MELKYYVPKLSEFRIGFEYFQSDTYAEPINLVRKIYNGGISVAALNIYLYEDCVIYAKYLDEQDIIDLGFEPSPDEPNEWFSSFKGNDSIQLYFNNKIDNPNLGLGISIYNYDLIFDGYVKNKSELIILLKQLDINNNEEKQDLDKV